MGVTVGTQAISISAAALGGLLAGLLYDLLRMIRRGGGRTAGFLCDLGFCLFCTGELFLIGMAFCGGSLGIWECCAFVLVFWMYLAGVSPSVAPIIGIIRKSGEKNLKKSRKSTK